GGRRTEGSAALGGALCRLNAGPRARQGRDRFGRFLGESRMGGRGQEDAPAGRSREARRDAAQRRARSRARPPLARRKARRHGPRRAKVRTARRLTRRIVPGWYAAPDTPGPLTTR